MDNQLPHHSDSFPPDQDLPHIEERFKDNSSVYHVGVWTTEEHAETSVEKNVRLTLRRIHIVGGVLGGAAVLFVLLLSKNLYFWTTDSDPVKPDYSSLDVRSPTYWTDRILLDIAAAQQSSPMDPIGVHRLRTFAYQTMNEAMTLTPPYLRAQAVTGMARVLAEQGSGISVDHYLQQLGTTPLISALHARTLISQTLMLLRQGKHPVARLTFRRYSQLVTNADLKLNSTVNEESFFGAVTILKCFDDGDGLTALFNQQKMTLAVLPHDQRMRAYRLIAGEQVRVGMTAAALATAKQISSPVELVRAWSLILHYTARPVRVLPQEPMMLNLPDPPAAGLPLYPYPAEQVIQEILQNLADHQEIQSQRSLLRRLAGSRLMCDKELHKMFRHCVAASNVLDDSVKISVLRLLDDPESPTIRAALQMPPRADSAEMIDTALDDWTQLDAFVPIEPAEIDPAPLRTHNEQQRIHARFAVARGYQSVRRFQDADRILGEELIAAQQLPNPLNRMALLLRIGEQQIAVGSLDDAKQTLSAAALDVHQEQKGELARLQIIARFFDDAQATIKSIEPAENRELVGSFLLQEQIRIHDIQGAEQTLALLPQGKTAAECRSRLNIAQGKANRSDYEILGISPPENGTERQEHHCIELIRQGFLQTADQAASRWDNAQMRADIQMRLAREYQLLLQSFHGVNDPGGSIRQSILQSLVSIAGQTGNPAQQAAILTELLTYLTEHMQNEEERAMGKAVWRLAITACRNIPQPNEKALIFAQLIAAKNLLEAQGFSNTAFPLFTRTSHRVAFDKTNKLIGECLAILNASSDEASQGHACVALAYALVQVGRTQSAQTLHQRVLEIVQRLSNRQQSIPMLLAMIPALKAMDSAEMVSVVYRFAIDEVIREFLEPSANIDVYEWRMRDSEIEQIVRSQMENGFINEAVESTSQLNEPVLRDRLLRSAAYMYLDQGDILRTELTASRMTVKSIQDEVLRNIQIIRKEPGGL